MVGKLSTALFLASPLLHAHHVVIAFTSPSPPSQAYSAHRRTTSSTNISMSSMFLDATEPKEIPEVKEQADANGKVFTAGSKVAIAQSLKAHAVPKAAYGSFDPISREFIPQDEANKSRGTSCLILPVGLRGEVNMVYNTNEWDRAHPIVVKFEAGLDREDGEDGFDVPKKFTMHFDADEIEMI